MTDTMTVLLVDPDVRARALLANQIASVAPNVMQTSDGATALTILGTVNVHVVVTELYLPTGEHTCLVQAIRANRALKRTHVVAHTHRCLGEDREWALTAGADAFLIKPTRAERLRYVVSRVGTVRGRNATVPDATTGDAVRRDSLDTVLTEIEAGTLQDTSSIVFARRWWRQLPKAQQAEFRQRARKARVSLRSDSLMKNSFVEVRGRSREQVALSSEQPESPYRRA